MIHKVEMYTIKCDDCGKLFDDDPFCAWDSKSLAWDNAIESDWIKGDDADTHYCPECYFP